MAVYIKAGNAVADELILMCDATAPIERIVRITVLHGAIARLKSTRAQMN
jgi:hypothetical protein